MKFTTGGIVGAMSGSVGGQTFSHNRYGAYVRNRSIPVNPSSSRQQAVRAIFQQLADFWNSTLTAAQRSAWNLYGASVAVKDALGQDIFLTGFNHYLRSNVPILDMGLTRVDDGPVIFTLAESDGSFSVSASEATQQLSVSFDTNLEWVGEDGAAMQVKMSRPVNPGQTFIPPTFQVAGQIEGDSGSPPTSPQTIAVPFAVSEGQRIMCEGRIVRADGRLSAAFRFSVAVGA